MVDNKRDLVVLTGVFLMLMVLLLSSSSFFSDVYNFSIGVLSLFLFLLSLYSIYIQKLRSFNVFLFVYFGSLFSSTWKLSIYQSEKSEIDLYYYFVGPVFFTLVLFIFEYLPRIKVERYKRFINIDIFYLIVLVFFIGLRIYIGATKGWRINTILYDTYLQSGDQYTIPGLSGLVVISQWLLLIFAPYTKKRYVIIAVVSIIILSGIMHVKRGDILRVFSFLFIWFIYLRIKLRDFSFRTISKLLIIILIGVGVFIGYGNIRQEARGDGESELGNNIGISGAPAVLSWFYGYVSINYEVIRLYYHQEPTNEPNSIKALFSGEDESFEPSPSVNGFNAPTILAGFIRDYGLLYFLEMTAFAIIIGILILLSKSVNIMGTYLFILSILGFSFFGNYLANRSIFIAIMLSIVIAPFLKYPAYKLN